jgi:pimeloyl-ACP methyl ester carboxylesterase
MIKIFLIITSLLLLIYVGAFLIAVLAQDKIVYPVPHKSNDDCGQKIANEVIMRDGTKIYHEHKEGSDSVVVFYHGNGDKVCDKVGLIDIFDEHNISYIFVEYEGYNDDEYKASSDGIIRSVENTVDFLNEKDYEHIYVIGQSIGTGAASYHASLKAPERLLLISPFTTLTDVVAKMFPMYPRFFIEMFLEDKFDNKNRLKEYSGELVVLHGTKDLVIPDKYGKELFDSVNTTNKSFVSADGYGHANIYPSQEMNESIKMIVR